MKPIKGVRYLLSSYLTDFVLYMDGHGKVRIKRKNIRKSVKVRVARHACGDPRPKNNCLLKHQVVSLLLIILFSFVMWGCSPAKDIPSRHYQTPGDYEETLDIEGTERTFYVHVPPQYKPGTPLPLVFNLHGRTASAQHQMEISQMNAKADEEGFVVVIPQADNVPPTWWGAVPGETGEADMLFFEALLEHLQTEISIDPERIYATGFSNGASMANRLGCVYSGVFAAVAPVAGGHVGWYDCEADHPVSVIAIHGIEDSIIPFEGNQNNPKVHEWVEAWAERNGCDSAQAVDFPDENVTRENWENCRGENLVTLYAIAQAGHTWPGSDFRIDFAGATQAINATDTIWEFFADHPKSGSAEEVPTEAYFDGSAYPTPGDYFDTIHTGGMDRTFKVHIPLGYQPQNPTPLVLNYHGRGSNAFEHEKFSDFTSKADQAGFIVVYPQATGSPTTWQDLPFDSEYSDAEVNEVLFASDLLDHLESELNIDPKRIYAVGMSNGGGMVHHLACDLADRFAAVAPVAGAFYLWDDCQPSEPISVVAFHSKKDNVVPYEGTDNPLFFDVPSIPVWAQAWADLNGCDPEFKKSDIDKIIEVDTWNGCDENSTVTLYSMLLGGHTWPPEFFGGTDADPVKINDVIWEFFENNPKQ